MLSLHGMKLGLLVLAAVTMLGCASFGRSSGTTTSVCTSRNVRGWCTHTEEREADEARWFRETSDERAREEAYKKGEPFFPSDIPGETSEHHVQRMDEERRRQDAYRKGEAFFPDNAPGESSEHYLKRMGEDQRRGDAYRKGDPFMPSVNEGR